MDVRMVVEHTEKTEEMLGAVDVDGATVLFAGVFFAEGTVLRTLVVVEQDLVKHDIKVLEQTDVDLVEAGTLDAAGALGNLFLAVVIPDLANGARGRESNNGGILADTLPVVDDEGLQVVGQGEADRRAVVKLLLLFGMFSIRFHLLLSG